MHKLEPTKYFKKHLLKLIKSGRLTVAKFDSFAMSLARNPFDKSLRTHKVKTQKLGHRYSSRLTGDLRVIWDFDETKQLVILLLDLGGHEGKRAVY